MNLSSLVVSISIGLHVLMQQVHTSVDVSAYIKWSCYSWAHIILTFKCYHCRRTKGAPSNTEYMQKQNLAYSLAYPLQNLYSLSMLYIRELVCTARMYSMLNKLIWMKLELVSWNCASLVAHHTLMNMVIIKQQHIGWNILSPIICNNMQYDVTVVCAYNMWQAVVCFFLCVGVVFIVL